VAKQTHRTGRRLHGPCFYVLLASRRCHSHLQLHSLCLQAVVQDGLLQIHWRIAFDQPVGTVRDPIAMGVRLQRQEATALRARLWLAPQGCLGIPLSAALPLSPRLAFLSAFTVDARNVDASNGATTHANARLLLAPGCGSTPASSDELAACAAPYAEFQRGAVLEVLSAEWSVKGLPTAAAILLNSTSESPFSARYRPVTTLRSQRRR